MFLSNCLQRAHGKLLTNPHKGLSKVQSKEQLESLKEEFISLEMLLQEPSIASKPLVKVFLEEFHM